MPLAIVNAVWIGTRLGPLHAACLRSFVRHGHEVNLFAYKRPDDLPSGVRCRDANELLPSDKIVRHGPSGSLAIFADFLRYELLKRHDGLYVDCDVFCFGPIEDAEHIFGYESWQTINNAVLKIPTGSEALADLCALRTRRGFVPPWATPKRQAYYRLRSRLGLPVALHDMPWGFTGPGAVTWYLKQHGLARHAQPIDVFYPLSYTHCSLLLDPDLRLEDLVTPRTKLVHLWDSTLKNVGATAIPPSSPLAQILAN